MEVPALGNTVKWASSGAGGQVVGTPRHNRILELHRLHFVEKKGHEAVQEIVSARCKEARIVDAKSVKENAAKLQELNDKITHKCKHALAYGSMSIWTKEERDKIEEARHDPVEAKTAATKRSRELAHNHKVYHKELNDRVSAQPAMNVRSKQEWEEIETARTDPNEALERIQAQMSQRKATFKEDRRAMTARVKCTKPTSLRSQEEKARIEEARQDPEEARQAMEAKMKEHAKSYKDEQEAMAQRVAARPCECTWSKDEKAEIEERRQDPEEAKARAKSHMKNLDQSYKEHQEAMTQRIQAIPPMNIRTKEERARIEEARQDPEEAKSAAKAHMKELHRSYQEHKKQIHERVHMNPLVTFRSPRSQEVVAQKILKNLSSSAH